MINEANTVNDNLQSKDKSDQSDLYEISVKKVILAIVVVYIVLLTCVEVIIFTTVKNRLLKVWVASLLTALMIAIMFCTFVILASLRENNL